jgi:hypothetical protein
MGPFKDLSSAHPTDVKNPHSDGVTIAFGDRLAVTGFFGLLGFGLTMIVFSFQNVSSYSHSSTIMGMARASGGIAQFVDSIFEFIKGSTFSGHSPNTYPAPRVSDTQNRGAVRRDLTTWNMFPKQRAEQTRRVVSLGV